MPSDILFAKEKNKLQSLDIYYLQKDICNILQWIFLMEKKIHL